MVCLSISGQAPLSAQKQSLTWQLRHPRSAALPALRHCQCVRPLRRHQTRSLHKTRICQRGHTLRGLLLLLHQSLSWQARLKHQQLKTAGCQALKLTAVLKVR